MRVYRTNRKRTTTAKFFSLGRIAGKRHASVGVVMEHYYWCYFQESITSSRNKDARFEAGIKSVVWGGMHLEALVNDKCHQFLALGARQQPVWDALRMARIEDKVVMLAQLARCRPQHVDNMVKRLRQVTALRNRLVHFKDRPTVIPVPKKEVLGRPVYKVYELLPQSAIELELNGRSMEAFRRNVRVLSRWVKDLEHHETTAK
jgi:hypothetical protein